MAERGRPKAALVLSDVERQTLLSWARRAKTAQALALRARIVLACADGMTNKDVAAASGIWPQTVTKWRGRFVTDRLAGLSDEPRPGAARKITDEQVEAVIVKTLEEAPANHDTHWSTRSMARAVGLNQTAVSRPRSPLTFHPAHCRPRVSPDGVCRHLVSVWLPSAVSETVPVPW
jgi:transposase